MIMSFFQDKFLIALLVIFTGCASNQVKSTSKIKISRDDEIILQHKFMTIAYSKEHLTPYWVSYVLTADHLKKNYIKRKGSPFHPDHLLDELNLRAVKSTDYSRSGYDRGHMAPAEDFAWDEAASYDSYMMTNIIPQNPKINQGPWKRLEESVRGWACAEGELTVITGSYFNTNHSKLDSGVDIPNKFWKIIVDETPPRKAIAFLYDQVDTNVEASERIVRYSDIAKLTGIEVLREAKVKEHEALIDQPAINAWKRTECVDKEQANRNRSND